MKFTVVRTRFVGRVFLLLGTFTLLTGVADELTLSPVADTFISESFPDKNFGAMKFFNGGTTQSFTTNRALLRFDIALPSNASILSVTLSLEAVGQPDEPWNSSDFGLHRMLRDWGEGNNTGSLPRTAGTAGLNEASWTHRFAGTEATWGVPGGEPNVDYVAARSAGEFVYDAGQPYTFGPTAGLAADVQFWLAHPESNFGWMLIVRNETTDFTARRFGSRESLNPIDFPQLTINYLLVPEPSTLSLLALALAGLVGRRAVD